jgi:hypothetical protein
MIFFCAGVLYSGEYDVCDLILSVGLYPQRTSLKNICPATVGIEPTTFGILADGQDGSSLFSETDSSFSEFSIPYTRKFW